jgi:4,5-DOPA dioxygenase extradiol
MYQPSLFISHGAPDIALKIGHPTYRFFQDLPHTFPRPDAVVILSAHWCTEHIMIAKNESYRAIHDFAGFDERLYSLRYSPKGSPELARIILDLLKQDNEFDAELVNISGLDHGVWVPLRLMYPDPFIPVVQVSIKTAKPPAYHYALGASLAELRSQNVLIVGSGAMTHNLSEALFTDHDSTPLQWVSEFASWMKERLEVGDKISVMDYQTLAPYAKKNHPTDDHIIPLFVAMGAGDGGCAKRIHTATSYGTVMMDAYKFAG